MHEPPVSEPLSQTGEPARTAPLDTEVSEQSRLYHAASMAALAEPGSTLSRILSRVPDGSAVLELGTSTGYMSQALAARGCVVTGVELDPAAARLAAAHCRRMLVGTLDDPMLLEQLGDDRFNVVLAADVLEHLRDPTATLRQATAHLLPDGIVVASIPNVAHVSVRIALAQGRFPYGQTGLLDRTHLQFFDRERLFDLFERSGLVVVTLTPQHVSPQESSVPYVEDEVAKRILADAEGDRYATAYQYIVTARRLDDESIETVASRIRELVLANEAVESRAAAQATELARLNEAIHRERARADAETARAARAMSLDVELRTLLVSSHEQLAERDEMLARLNARVATVEELERELEREREARLYFESESREIHDKLFAITASRGWRAMQLLRRVRARLR
jgi:2-polyprenyl-3-methyl-5-hydroxy-6-metoxy-1,4-benzoquinol methylase